MSYFPVTADRSGEIMAGGIVGAAQANANMLNKFSEDIGGSISDAITSLAAAYGQRKGIEAKGKNFKKFMGMAGNTFGMDGSLFADMEDYDAGMMLEDFGSWMPAMANAQLGRSRMGVQQNQQALSAAMPGIRNQANNQADIVSEGGASIPGAVRRRVR